MAMTDDETRAFIAQHSNDALAKEHSVYQVWEDGEVTVTKGGDLLGQRGVYCIAEGTGAKGWPVALFPHQNSSSHGFAYVTKEGAKAIRNAIFTEEIEKLTFYKAWPF